MGTNINVSSSQVHNVFILFIKRKLTFILLRRVYVLFSEDARSKGFPLTGEGLLNTVKVAATYLCDGEGDDKVTCADDKTDEAVDLKLVGRQVMGYPNQDTGITHAWCRFGERSWFKTMALEQTLEVPDREC